MRTAPLFLALIVGLVGLSSPGRLLQARQGAPGRAAGGAVDRGSVSMGEATDRRAVKGVPPACPNPVMVQPDVFPVQVGTVTSEDGKKWVVPAPVTEGAVAPDVYDTCIGTGDNPGYLSQLQTVVIDKDGVEITGYIHADNYFELYVNGRYVARDSIPMTPFNTSVVRFRARYPMTYAIMGVDWETHGGVGMEYAQYNVGDAGMIAYFSDGNGTHTDWRAETFYVAPLDDPNCVRVTAAGRDSSFCSQAVRPVCAQKDPKECKALHFEIPPDWTSPKFSDARWPAAIFWRPEEVTNQPAYVNYAKLFGDAEFIWTRNLHLDNLVLARYTAKGPRR
ncbi:MAG: hypothetical protein HY824_16165, partial [Acidobacteria bacterium]|nr:hypothetical protein [Acidobacteriota bacterium]